MTKHTARKANAPRQRGEGEDERLQDSQIIADMRERVKARMQVGETVAATDHPESERSAFWGAIALLQDEFPNLKPTWRTISEYHVDGRRLRQKVFRLRGHVDTVLAGWLTVAVSALALALRGCLA